MSTSKHNTLDADDFFKTGGITLNISYLFMIAFVILIFGNLIYTAINFPVLNQKLWGYTLIVYLCMLGTNSLSLIIKLFELHSSKKIITTNGKLFKKDAKKYLLLNLFKNVSSAPIAVIFLLIIFKIKSFTEPYGLYIFIILILIPSLIYIALMFSQNKVEKRYQESYIKFKKTN